MHSRNIVLTAFLSSLITVLLIAVVFSGVGTTLANNASQEGDPPPPESEGILSPDDPESLETTLSSDYFHLSGYEFKPFVSSTTYENSTYGCMYVTGGDPFLWAPVYIPDGSHLTFFRWFFKDSSASVGYLRLVRIDDGGGLLELAKIDTIGYSDGLVHTDYAILNDYIDSIDYSYGLEWNAAVASAIQICGAYITYTPPFFSFGSALPIIKK